jgi:hypothetical protein
MKQIEFSMDSRMYREFNKKLFEKKPFRILKETKIDSKIQVRYLFDAAQQQLEKDIRHYYAIEL